MSRGVYSWLVLQTSLLVFLITVSFLLCKVSSSEESDVYLTLTVNNGEKLPNNSVVRPGDLTSSSGIFCCIANNELDANWVPLNDNLVTVKRQSCLELLLESERQVTDVDGGIYTCNIQDSTGSWRRLFVGIYSLSSYDSSTGPALSSEEPITLQLLSALSYYPPSFSLNCSSTSYPPTVVSWLLNDSSDDDQLSTLSTTSQFVRDAKTTTYDNILSVSNFNLTGRVSFTCILNNTRGSQRAKLFVDSPSGPPANVNITTPGNNTVQLNWSPPGNVQGYRIFYRNASITNMVLHNEPTSDSAILPGLLSGVEYSITVQALADLPSEMSAPIIVTLLAPGPPTISMSAMTVSPTSIYVSWTQSSPTDTIVGYGISYSPVRTDCPQISSGLQTVEGGNVREYTVTDLQEGLEYAITVQARGAQAFGIHSNSVGRFTQNSAPSAPPTNVFTPSLPTESRIQVMWSSPPCEDINSQTQIRGYEVRYRPIGTDDWILRELKTAVTSTNIEGIVMLVVYEVQVAARNEVGLGPFSVSVMASVSARAPGQVTSLTVTPDITSLTVSWQPPVIDEGRGFISKYQLCYMLAETNYTPNCVTLSGEDETEYRVRKLLINTSYLVTVRATVGNFVGPTVKTEIATSPIGVVQSVRVERVGETSVSVTWLLLDSLDISSYVVATSSKAEKQVNIISVRPNASSVLVTSRHNTVTYSYQVAAVVLVNNVPIRGNLSPITSDSTLPAAVNAGIIAGVLVALSILLVGLVLVVILLAYCFCGTHTPRKKGRSGHFEIPANRDSSIELKSRSHQIPLPNFERKPLHLASSKPVIQHHPKDAIAIEGERVTFEPKVSGSPLPTVAWYHNDHMVSANYAIDIGEDGSLTFVCVENKHAGIYRFTVSNSGGSVQDQVNLFVLTADETIDGRQNGDGPPKVTTVSMPIEDFGTYLEDLHGDNNKGFRDQYYSLCGGEEGHDTKWGTLPENKHLNRFTNIVPYDDNRVKLKPLLSRQDCQHDYINASYVDGYSKSRKFIASQGPMDVTLVDFWRLVWQTQSPLIVMITNLHEGTKVKCIQYWPVERGHSSEYGPFKVAFLMQQEFADFTVRQFSVSLTARSCSPLEVVQCHYTSWPDHGVPEYVGPMLAFHRMVTAKHRPDKGPIIVHCSAGVGRTGTYIAINSALEQVENENNIDIPIIVTELRSQRMKSVQTDEQYVFIHDAVFESLTCGNTQISGANMSATLDRLSRVSTYTAKSGFHHQFEVLSKVTPKSGSCSTASAYQNPDKNRDMDHLPSERHRVILKAEYPDYIHASFVNGYKKKKAIIVAQGPLPGTCRNFWKMVYERNCTAIIMLSALEDNGKEVCCRYWPESKSIQFGEFAVSALEQSLHYGYIERVLSVTDSKSGQTHCISQFQLNQWETVGEPASLPSQHMPLLSIVTHVLSLQKNNQSGPIVVHCSDSIGRSAVFCAAATLIEYCRVEDMMDVFQVVKALRVQKTGAIPTVEHYQYIHELMLTFLNSNDHSPGNQFML